MCYSARLLSPKRTPRSNPPFFFFGGGVGERKEPGNMSFFFFAPEPYHLSQFAPSHRWQRRYSGVGREKGHTPCFPATAVKGETRFFSLYNTGARNPQDASLYRGGEKQRVYGSIHSPHSQTTCECTCCVCACALLFRICVTAQSAYRHVHYDHNSYEERKKKKRLIIIRKEAQPPKGNIEQCRHVSSLPSLCVFCFLSSFLPVAASRTRRQQGGRWKQKESTKKKETKTNPIQRSSPILFHIHIKQNKMTRVSVPLVFRYVHPTSVCWRITCFFFFYDLCFWTLIQKRGTSFFAVALEPSPFLVF